MKRMLFAAAVAGGLVGASGAAQAQWGGAYPPGGPQAGGMMPPGMGFPGTMPQGMGYPGMMPPGMMPPGMGHPGMMPPGMGHTGMMPPGMMPPGGGVVPAGMFSGHSGHGAPSCGGPACGAPACGAPTNGGHTCGEASGEDDCYGAHPWFKKLFGKSSKCKACEKGEATAPGLPNYPGGMPGTLVFPNHQFVRSPRDFFMYDVKYPLDATSLVTRRVLRVGPGSPRAKARGPSHLPPPCSSAIRRPTSSGNAAFACAL